MVLVARSACMLGVLLLCASVAAEESAVYKDRLQPDVPVCNPQLTSCTLTHAGTDADPCEATSGTGTDADPFVFEASMDHFVSSTGYYRFKGCGPTVKPALKMIAGKAYKFDQTHVSNWMHPIGLAYYPDGAHAGVDELELTVEPPSKKSAGCKATSSCDSPKYYGGKDGTTYLGGTENTVLTGATEGYFAGVKDGGFGLDTYEPQFKFPLATWQENKYNVQVKIADTGTKLFFYFCHIHSKMSGKIHVFDEGVQNINRTWVENPSTFYDPIKLSAEDKKCGFTSSEDYGDATGPSGFGVVATQTKKGCSPALCGAPSVFKDCLEAVDCAMNYNMRVKHGSSAVVTFMRQMIPHHQNAVNMAKVLLKNAGAKLDAEDVALGDDPFLNELIQSIINSQNGQIMTMQTYLEHAKGAHKSKVVLDSACAEEIAKSTTTRTYPASNKKTRRGSQNDVKKMFTEPELLQKLHLSIGQRKLLEESAAYDGGLQAPDETSPAHAGTDADPCEATSGTGTDADPFVFEAMMDHFVSSTGYYRFKGCGPTVKPALKIKAGSAYKFVQTHMSNWMHPIGLAYYPDGAHAEVDELELEVEPPSGASAGCKATSTCDSPKYYGGKDGTTYLGGTANTVLTGAQEGYFAGVTDGGFGLDTFEPQFKFPLSIWQKNKYNVQVKITDAKTAQFFYFCHIHNWMSGKIFVTNADGTARTATATYPTFYDPVKLSDEDTKCGYTPAPHYGDVSGPGAFGYSKVSGESMCMEKEAVCGATTEFSACLEQVDCHMTVNMKVTHAPAGNEIITFMRQMIPHHQNAVNMVKVLMKTSPAEIKMVETDADLIADETSPFLFELLQDIINTQNGQIMSMYDYLKTKNQIVYDSTCSGVSSASGVSPMWAFVLATASVAVFII